MIHPNHLDKNGLARCGLCDKRRDPSIEKCPCRTCDTCGLEKKWRRNEGCVCWTICDNCGARDCSCPEDEEPCQCLACIDRHDDEYCQCETCVEFRLESAQDFLSAYAEARD